MSDCPACLNGCGGVRTDCPMREGGPLVRPVMGRPVAYTPDVAAEICDLIASGLSMVKVCERDDMPHRSNVLRWLAKYPEFAAGCARARELQADVMDDMILDTARDCTPENHQAAKVQIAAYQWRASKLKPKVYGDKVTQELTGPGGGPVAIMPIVTTDPIEAARAYQRMIKGDS